MLPWLWCRPAGAAPIQLLAQEFPYAAGLAIKIEKKKYLLNDFDSVETCPPYGYDSEEISHSDFLSECQSCVSICRPINSSFIQFIHSANPY